MTYASESTVYQGSYLGLQTNLTTKVPAIIKLAALDFDIMPRPRIKGRRSNGHKFVTGHTRAKESSEAKLSGPAGYFDLAYYFCGLLGTPVITQVTATKTWDWVWTPSPGCADDFQVYTAEKGCGTTGAQLGTTILQQGSITINETDVTVDGSAFGQLIADGFTVTTPTQDLPDIPIDPGSFDVSISNTNGSYTPMDNLIEAKWQLGDRRNPQFLIKRADTSFSKVKELSYEGTQIDLTVIKDSTADTMLSDLRAATKKWIKIDSLGPIIPDDTGKNYNLTIISPFKYINTDRGDKGGIYGATYNLEPILDTTFGSGLKVTMRLPFDTLANVTRIAAVYNLY